MVNFGIFGIAPASNYPTLDFQGIYYKGYLDGNFYSIKDWNNDGIIDKEKEVCVRIEAVFPPVADACRAAALLRCAAQRSTKIEKISEARRLDPRRD